MFEELIILTQWNEMMNGAMSKMIQKYQDTSGEIAYQNVYPAIFVVHRWNMM